MQKTIKMDHCAEIFQQRASLDMHLVFSKVELFSSDIYFLVIVQKGEEIFLYNNITVLEWPGNLSNFNPIENF